MRFRAGPVAVGVLLAAASAGLLAGLTFVGPVGRRLGVTGAIVAGFAIMATGNLLTAAAPWLIAAVAAQVLRGLAVPLADSHVHAWSKAASGGVQSARRSARVAGWRPVPSGGWETTGVFVVDDLVGWVIGRLADAGYQKLITLVRGSDQARALKPAVTAAVEATVGEISPSDGEEADRVAEQINKAFRRREPVPLPPGQPTVLEAMQAGIAGQLSVLDDAGQPAVSPPGIPVSVVADKLTGHLTREIMIRGSQPGPLTPLAGQLNHDLTHLQGQQIEGQGQRIEGMLAQLLDWLGDTPAAPGSAAGPVGWPLAEVRDPFALEVHRPVEPDVSHPGLPVLPVYVPREHDTALAEVVAAAAAGTSGIAVLVGGSSTGKTRACWQALELLRGQEPEWRLWHPIDPTRPDAALRELPPPRRPAGRRLDSVGAARRRGQRRGPRPGRPGRQRGRIQSFRPGLP